MPKFAQKVVAGLACGLGGPALLPLPRPAFCLSSDSAPEITSNCMHRSQSFGVTLHGATFDALW